MRDPVIEIKDLVKRYGKANAVDGIDLSVDRGEVFAFLGPNGAGKTTTVEIIEGIRKPSNGTVRVLGRDIQRNGPEIKPRIGVLPQEFSSFDKITVKETLSFYSSLYKNGRKPDELMELLGIKEHSSKLYQNLSGGLKQRVGIAVALVNDPEIVFLDEPTTGLDPHSRHEVWKVIKGLKEQGKTVFLTTHYMEEAQELADRVAIIHRGKISAEGTVDDLIERYGFGHVLTFTGTGPEMGRFLRECSDVSEKGDSVSIRIKDKDSILGTLELVKGAGLEYKGFNVRRSNLEEVFLSVTGESLKEEQA